MSSMSLSQASCDRLGMFRAAVSLSGRLLSLAVLLLSAVAVAQESPSSLSEVGNSVQQPVGSAVQAVCGGFVQAFGSPDAVEDQMQRDLFLRCREMVHTANLVIGNEGPTAFAITDIESIEGIAAALQQIGTEELSAEGSNVTETSRVPLALKRLASLRAGGPSVSIAGLDVGLNGRVVQIASLLDHAQAWNRSDPNVGQPAYASGKLSRHVSDASQPVVSAIVSASASASGSAGSQLFGSSRWGLFVDGMIGFGERDTTAQENGFDFTVPGLTLGLDYRFGDDLIVGGAASYESFEADFDRTLTVTGGTLTSDLTKLSLYSSYYSEKFYLDWVASYGWNDYDITRRIVYPTVTRTADADTDGNQYEIAAAIGYAGSSGSLQYSPYIRLSALNLDIDGYTETGAMGLSLEVSEQKIESLLSTVGARFSWAISKTSGVVVPSIKVEWYHEFENDARLIAAKYANDPFDVPFAIPTDEPDTNFFSLGTGISGVWKKGTQAFVDVETLIGLENMKDYMITAGVRFEL